METSQDEPPSIAALFVVVFDQKVGYKIAWHRSLSGTDVDGVEYQALPSGLHSVREDLVYFTHGTCAGVSAFAQEESDKQHRNASFAAVGALVQSSDGKLGRSWLHAEALRGLAREQAKKLGDRSSLEDYWEKHGKVGNEEGATAGSERRASQGNGYKRKRSLSGASRDLEGAVTADHPGLSMPTFLSTFGPLVFPLHRAAILRKRILLLGSTPVQPACNYVYDLSLLSDVPSSARHTLQLKGGTKLCQPLFSVGVSDITRLEKHENGWLACTTDDILGEKKKLYDLLVELPTSGTADDGQIWPKIRASDGRTIKASQRDFRRYCTLQRELARHKRKDGGSMRYRDDASAADDEGEDAPLVQSPSRASQWPNPYVQTASADIVEPETWSAAAYRSLMWWSSAGEMEAWEAEEAASDQALLDDLSDADEQDDSVQHLASMLIAYFHRLTATFVQKLASIVDETDDQADEDDTAIAVLVSADNMRNLGLDAWNENDKAFVQEAVKLYFNREATVRDEGVWMCGVRIC